MAPPGTDPATSGLAARPARPARPSHFERGFLPALAPAVAAYPEARIEIGEDGLLPHPSRPPVAPRLVAARSSRS